MGNNCLERCLFSDANKFASEMDTVPTQGTPKHPLTVAEVPPAPGFANPCDHGVW